MSAWTGNSYKKMVYFPEYIYIYNVEQIQLKLKALMITIHTYLKISPSQYSAVSILWHVAVGDSLNQ